MTDKYPAFKQVELLAPLNEAERLELETLRTPDGVPLQQRNDGRFEELARREFIGRIAGVIATPQADPAAEEAAK